MKRNHGDNFVLWRMIGNKNVVSQENKFKVMSLKFYHIWLENIFLNYYYYYFLRQERDKFTRFQLTTAGDSSLFQILITSRLITVGKNV